MTQRGTDSGGGLGAGQVIGRYLPPQAQQGFDTLRSVFQQIPGLNQLQTALQPIQQAAPPLYGGGQPPGGGGPSLYAPNSPAPGSSVGGVTSGVLQPQPQQGSPVGGVTSGVLQPQPTPQQQLYSNPQALAQRLMGLWRR